MPYIMRRGPSGGGFPQLNTPTITAVVFQSPSLLLLSIRHTVPRCAAIKSWPTVMSGMGYEMFGFVISVVSTAFFIPKICGWVKSSMPSAKMSALDALLFETEALLRSALEEGTIDYGQYDRNFRSRIWVAKASADQFRAEIYTMRGQWHELRCWLEGMSRRISAVMDSLYKVRAQVAVSSSRGRQHLAKLGHTANPAFDKYARRDMVSSLVLPDCPAGAALAACPLQPCPLEDKTDAVAVVPSPLVELAHDVALPSSLHPSAGLLADDPPAYDGPAELTPHALPPLVFRLKEQAAFGSRRVERVVLHRVGKHSPSVNSAHTGHKERRGFPGPFRIFSGFFQRSSATLPATASSPDATSLLTSSPSEKGTHLPTALWEGNGYVAVQVKLPV
ncbi:hypothetical protein C8T65DRAFT_278566 [Cerioporus squamosus]|nr:hypothetical protein C8T65DRAFT_278566 [Cerioporus squamosus]